jgi:anti-sigma B factor antagonist
MFEIEVGADETIVLIGRFDAAQVEKATPVFTSIAGARTLDFGRLDYISSAGLGLLLATQKRLSKHGTGLRIVNLNPHIRNVFHYAGFDRIFQID